jgi:hypothetical protein
MKAGSKKEMNKAVDAKVATATEIVDTLMASKKNTQCAAVIKPIPTS